MAFKKEKKVPIGLATAKKLMDYTRQNTMLFEGKCIKLLYKNFSGKCFYEDGKRYLKLTTYWPSNLGGQGMATYVFDKTSGKESEALKNCSEGMNCFSVLMRMLKEDKELIPILVKDKDLNEGKNFSPFSASPLLWNNKKYDSIPNDDCWGYDINSAYSAAMLKDIPDTRGLPGVNIAEWNPGIVQEDEIGFNSHGDIVLEGNAIFRFKKIPSPFKYFVDFYYQKKLMARNNKERQKAKDMLNLTVGYMQRKNPFIRAAIVGYANWEVKKVIDENTLYCNTDSIVSLKERKDIKLSKNIGEWKLEHRGTFKFIGMNYQWDNEKPCYRGTPKAWFNKNYDILKDALPSDGNIYEINKFNWTIERKKLNYDIQQTKEKIQ